MAKQVWALVTGASGGIGREFALCLAEHGVSVVVTARSGAKLAALAREIEKRYGVKALAFPANLGDRGDIQKLVAFVANKKVTVEYLVNNAGFGDFGPFLASDWKKDEDMIAVNVTALTYLTKVYGAGMAKRGSGRIVNVASGAAFQPGPLMAMYFASKAYVLHFTEAVAEELAGTGVTVTALCPGPTSSNFWRTAGSHEQSHFYPWSMPSSAAVARYGYEAMIRGDRVAIHGIVNRFGAFAIRFVPRGLVTKMVKRMQAA